MPKVNDLPRAANPNTYNRAMAEVWNYSPVQGGVSETPDAKKVYQASTKVAATPMSEKSQVSAKQVGQNGAPLPVQNIPTNAPVRINVTSDLEKIGTVGSISSDKLQSALGGYQKKIQAATKAEGEQKVTQVAKRSADQLRASVANPTPAKETKIHVERQVKANAQPQQQQQPAQAVEAQFKTQIEGTGGAVKKTA